MYIIWVGGVGGVVGVVGGVVGGVGGVGVTIQLNVKTTCTI